MADTIKIGNLDISAFKVGSDDCKVYLGDILLYPTGGYKVCYAVVDDINLYSETEFEDVYDKATEKWFKLNNLSQYEQYGIYGSGRNVTTYEGKLTIDDGYEYEWNGSSWVNLGEVSGSTIDTIWFDPSATNALFNIGHYWGENYKMVITTYLSGSYSGDFGSFWQYSQHTPIELSFYSNGFYYDMHNPTSTTAPNVRTTDYDFRILNQNAFINYQNSQVIDITLTYGSFKAELADSGTLIYSSGSTKTGYSWYSGLYQANIGLNNANAKCHLSHIQIYNGNNELVNDFKFIKNNGVVGSQEISIYDSVTNTTYNNTNSNTPVYHIVSDSGGTEYPIYYDEKAEPLDNLTFNTLAEAQAYAEANCVYVGLKATIDGNKYVFSGDSQSGYEWVYNPSRLPIGYTEVEYIENESVAYINTSFKPNQDTRVIARMQTVTSMMHARFFGAGTWNGSNGYQFDYENYYNGQLHISWGAINGWSTYNYYGDYSAHTYDWNKNVFTIDNGVFSAETTYTSFQCTDNLGLFVHIYNGNPCGDVTPWTEGYERSFLHGRLYSCQIYDNGTLIRDLVPCTRDSDSKVGVYDIVNDVFYSSAYSGYEFTAGNPV